MKMSEAVQRLASENSKLSDPKMFAAERFLPFILLFILHNVSRRCQDEKEKSKEETDDTNSIHSAHHTLRQLNQDIRPFSNTDFEEDEEKYIFNTDYYHTKIRCFRPKRNSPVRSIASIRKRLNEERKRDELMAADAFPKMEPNDSDLIKHAMSNHRNGVNSEQLYNRETDKIWQLHQKHIADKQIEYKTGIDCDFENDCQWTWRKDVANGFFITSGGKNGANETGPRVDAEKREGGSFLLLRLPLESTEFHVTSPLLTSTILSCKLAVWIYQEGMKGGIIRIVGDRPNVNAQWLIKIIPGDNSKKWHKHDMLLGKYSTNFTIILEVVPSENMVKGATVTFDNIRLSQCYHKNNDSCMVNQYKCKNTQTCIHMFV